MKKSTLLLALAFASLLVRSASAQYLNALDFSDPSQISSLGNYSIGANAGTYTVASGRLEYSSSIANTSKVLIVNDSGGSSYTQDWTASLTASNLVTAPNDGYTLMGFQAYSAQSQSGFFGLYLYRSSSGTTGVIYEKGRSTDGTLGTIELVSYVSPTGDLSDVLLRMSYDSATHDVTLAHSFDNGATYADATYFNPNQTFSSGTWGDNMSAGSWYAEPTGGFSFRLLGMNTGSLALDGSSLFADNFSVIGGQTAMSAIPEPSTYAAFAGVGALGLALWRRRKVATVPGRA